ncbi:MAG TPA: DUF6401 family natural product biosynthesis protein [Streptosporangiaceae bacterium]|jgi:hypothetical protein|nr:DUF6401 family natural product biosynthesis protein [Streptosporangiaceae bacterium]
MAEPSASLSAAALRLAGHVGQTALERVADDGGVAAVAELDQHIAAVRAELAACQQPPAARAYRGAATRGGSAHRGGRTGHLLDLGARLAGLRSAGATCPDVPFVSDARQAEETVPITLLLHYACGFVEAAVSSDWWPDESADATDWASLRLAAICQLIVQAEAAAELHPDLRASA